MAKLNYKSANLRGLGTDHQLKPGENTVDDEVWKRWKNHPHVKDLIDAGDLVVLGETEKPKGKPGPKPKGEGDGKPEQTEAEKLKAEMQAAIDKAEAEAKAAAAKAAK